MDDTLLSSGQLLSLARALRAGAAEASVALGTWLARPAQISLDSVEQMPLEQAAGVLGDDEQPICFCAVGLEGRLGGCMLLAFDDPSGLTLADLLMDQPPGTATEWNEMEMSAALETANIVCCAYLNALSPALFREAEASQGAALMPTPPQFSRDYPTSLVEFALMGQIVASDQVLVAQTNFQIDGVPLDWKLLFVPDAQSMELLRDHLAAE